ncbi:hypothetical protein [Umezawaea beigongshangensis]|uniref:hypothetical protein n=1 Tax=Umezawaea beigongshangensis TaxID=2780383 RepID=UPI0018F27862|nr:hypothetical protein [Umezawaea beigongshangensis]
MGNHTHAAVVGNVVGDPTRRPAVDGTGVVGLRAGTAEHRFDRETRERVDGDRLLDRCSAEPRRRHVPPGVVAPRAGPRPVEAVSPGG